MADTRFTRAAEGFGRSEPPKTLTKTDARQAVTMGSVRYVLGISLALVVVAFAIIYFVYL